MENLGEAPSDALGQSLEQGDPARRRDAVAELGRRGWEGEQQAISMLIDTLGDADQYLGDAASDALARIGEPAVGPLIDVLSDRAARLNARLWAARTLTHVHDPRASESMLPIVQDASDDMELRRVVTRYLGRLGDGRVLDPLIEMVSDPGADVELRVNAAAALGELRDTRAFEPLLALLHQEDVRYHTELMRRDLQRLEAMQREASGDLVEQLAHQVEQARQGKSFHWEIGQALRELADPRSIEPVLPMLGSDDPDLRETAAVILGSLGEPAVPSLLAALESEDSRIREGAARAITFSGDRRAVVPLIDALLHDKATAVRAAAASSLGELGDERVPEALAMGLRDESVQVRQTSAQSLFNLALTRKVDPPVLARVLPALEQAAERDDGAIDGQMVVREAAVRAAREIRQALGE